jgi:hypothetical protein
MKISEKRLASLHFAAGFIQSLPRPQRPKKSYEVQGLLVAAVNSGAEIRIVLDQTGKRNVLCFVLPYIKLVDFSAIP